MKRETVRWMWCFVFLTAVFLQTLTSCSSADDNPRKSLPTRPYFTVCASSIDRLTEACENVFQSVDRSDLAESLNQRRKLYRDFAGLRRNSPVGVMSVWSDDKSSDIVFLPVDNIDELLKTATFEVVGYHAVSEGRYEIERPVNPYHVLVRNGYAYFGDDVALIQAVQVTPEQLTRSLRDRYDVAVQVDLNQIPRTTKVDFAQQIRGQISPGLQPQDDESPETARLRKAVGTLLLDLFERAVIDTSEITIGGRLDPQTRHVVFEGIVEASPRSVTAAALSRLTTQRSQFAPLISSAAPVAADINLPIGGIVEQVLGINQKSGLQGGQLETGLQVVGNQLGQLGIIVALRGDEARQLNDAIPGLIQKIADSGHFDDVLLNFDSYDGVALHSMIPRGMPELLRDYVGKDAELIIGQSKEIAWLAIGPQNVTLDHLKKAIEVIGSPQNAGSSAQLVRGRFHARLLPDLVATDLLSPNLDSDAARAAFDQGGDKLSLSLEPISSGFKLKLEAEEGFVRLLGRNWSRQLDELDQ